MPLHLEAAPPEAYYWGGGKWDLGPKICILLLGRICACVQFPANLSYP